MRICSCFLMHNFRCAPLGRNKPHETTSISSSRTHDVTHAGQHLVNPNMIAKIFLQLFPLFLLQQARQLCWTYFKNIGICISVIQFRLELLRRCTNPHGTMIWRWSVILLNYNAEMWEYYCYDKLPKYSLKNIFDVY